MIFKNINSEDISGLIICSEPPISSSAIRTKETTIDGRDGAIVEKLGYKTRIRNVEIGLKKDANVDKILSYFSGEGDLIFKNENDKVYKAAIYEQVDLERLLRLRKGSVAFYCQPFKYKRNDIFETIKDNKVKEKKGEYLELLNCAEQNVVDLKLEGSTKQATRSGKNLLNVTAKTTTTQGLTITVNEDKSITINGTNTGTGTAFFRLADNFALPAGDYTLSNKNPSVNNNSGFIFYDDGDNFPRTNISNATFTKDTTIKPYLKINAGVTINNQTIYPMIIKGTYTEETLPPYEQYGASPSPDYPSPIENVEGKNKLNISTIVKGRLDSGVISYETNVTKLILNKNSFTFTVDSTYKGVSSDFIPVIPTKTYVYSQNESLTDSFYIGVACYDKNKNWLKNLSIVSITIPSDCYYIKIQWASLTIGTQTVTNPQLEEGTIATPYVPYNSLEIKDIGENLFDCANSKIIYNNGNASYERLDNGLKPISNGVSRYQMIYFLVDTVKNLKNKILTLSSDISFSKDNQLTSFGLYYTDTNGGNRKTIVDNNNITSEGKYQVTGQVEEGENRYYVCIGLRPNMDSNFAKGDYTIYDNLQVEIGETATPYKTYQEQKVDFPLSEGQKLYEGSYLASDGIHHKRKQYTFTGNETVYITTYGNNKRFTVVPSSYNPSYKGQDTVGLCNYLKRDYMGTVGKATLAQEPCFFIHSAGILITMTPDTNIVNETQLKTWLATQYANGTPVIIEYELSEEEIVPYITAQQEAHNQLQKLKLYKGQNTMFSMEGSIINLKYLEDTDEKVENQGNIYSKPIIRLEKTVFKEVEIAINGIRFKYNFEEDDYVEIDCEQMTVQYEGLDRNRRLVIDFEFPKLKEGNNDIIMYDGDCIIKCKRKDRWL